MSDFFSRFSQWVRMNQQSISFAMTKHNWIKTMREHSALTGKEFAARLNVSPARVSVMEKDEQRGAVTLSMLKKSADALDCELIYFLVPRDLLTPAKQTEKPRIKLEAD